MLESLRKQLLSKTLLRIKYLSVFLAWYLSKERRLASKTLTNLIYLSGVKMVEEIIVIEEHTEDPNSSKENNVTVIQTQAGFD